MATSDTPAPRGGSSKPTGGFSLTNKVGPFPLWVYMVVIVAAVVIYEKRKNAAAPAAATVGGAAPGGYGSAANGAPGGFGTGVSGPQTSLEYALAANAGQATTNPQWEANAESVLVGEGYPYVQIQSALNQYLSGGVLSSIQQEIVNAAILAVGAPPSPPSTQASSTASPTVAAGAVVPPQNQQVSPQAPPPQTGIDWKAYPQTTENGEGITILGTITGAGGQYTGENVSGGAPVYALIDGMWRQGFNAKTLPVGTPLATLTTFLGNIGNYATESL